MKVRLQFIIIWNVTIILMLFAGTVRTQSCNRRPQGVTGDRSPADENFQVLIDGNPTTYIPNQRYHISLSCAESLKFIDFTLIVESENVSRSSDDMVGHFEITNIAETKFSVQCKNMIESTNTNVKQRIDVDWIAPSNVESGCIVIKAAVVMHRDVWFVDGGLLNKRICPEEIDDINIQTQPNEFCCACDEAKYEIVLERKWTRNTHAKDFPEEEHRTRLSEVVGASHTFDYRFWEYGMSASDGLKLMGEHGSTRALEREISANSPSIRTIIKAPGIKFRKNVMGTTLANVRVDPQHHLISFVTKIDPSPDWILGIASLELCLSNCTWIDSKDLNLYPWDIGTDEGPTYTDQPQRPPDVIRRLTSTFPSDRRSPFYNEDGAPMKPLATVHITRKKLYERECEFVPDQTRTYKQFSTFDENVRMECTTHPWNSWTECSTKCGTGIKSRSRAYKNPSLAQRVNCEIELNQEEECTGLQCGGDGIDVGGGADCQLTQWSRWSACSGECGQGYKIRTRGYVNPSARDICQVDGENVELQQSMSCVGNCGGNRPPDNRPFDNRQFENRPIDNRPFDNRAFDNRAFENSPFENRPSDKRPFDNRPFDSTPFDNGLSDNTPFDNGLSDNRPSDNAPFDNGPSDSRPFENRPFDNRPFDNIPFDNRPFDNRPFDNRPYGGIESLSYYQNSARKEDIENVRKTVDENGRVIITAVGSDPSQYMVVQEYCLKKPYAIHSFCSKENEFKNYWFYDAENYECGIFTTNGCDDNKNKFNSLIICEENCLRPHINYERKKQQGGGRERSGHLAEQYAGDIGR